MNQTRTANITSSIRIDNEDHRTNSPFGQSLKCEERVPQIVEWESRLREAVERLKKATMTLTDKIAPVRRDEKHDEMVKAAPLAPLVPLASALRDYVGDLNDLAEHLEQTAQRVEL